MGQHLGVGIARGDHQVDPVSDTRGSHRTGEGWIVGGGPHDRLVAVGEDCPVRVTVPDHDVEVGAATSEGLQHAVAYTRSRAGDQDRCPLGCHRGTLAAGA